MEARLDILGAPSNAIRQENTHGALLWLQAGEPMFLPLGRPQSRAAIFVCEVQVPSHGVSSLSLHQGVYPLLKFQLVNDTPNIQAIGTFQP